MNRIVDYWQARENFLQAAEKSGFRTMRFRIPSEESPELFQDFAILKRDPNKFLIHISGVHGIEGYAGSEIQRNLFSQTFSENGPSLLFIHAVNPLGMAYYRRANGENVDLNRNFRSGPAKPNPDYDFFHKYLNPSSTLDWWTGPAKALMAKWKLGEERSGQAIASGQVKYPKGLFYMGTEVQREIFLIQEFLRAHVQSAKFVVCLDFHTGLGNGEMLIVDRAQRDLDEPFFAQKFEKIWVPDPKTKLYENQGRFSDGVRHALPQAKVHYLLQEIGTRGPTQTLRALRKENWQWFRRNPTETRPDSLKNEMLEAFYPSDSSWREKTTQLGIDRFLKCLDLLQQS